MTTNPINIEDPGHDDENSHGFYSADEVKLTMANLVEADWSKILLAENRFSARSKTKRVLWVEALDRVTDGRRQFSRKYSVIECLIGTMRSIASEGSGIEDDPMRMQQWIDFIWASQENPELKALSRIVNTRDIVEIVDIVSEDFLLRQLIDAIGEEMEGEEICKELSITKKQLATLRKKLKRAVKHIKLRRCSEFGRSVQ